MRELAERALGLLPRDVEYGDVRVVNHRHEGVHVENGVPSQVIDEETEGIAVRALVGGQWGFMATAANGDDVQRRSFPQSVPRAIKGQRGDFATAGWEHVLSLGLVGEAPRVGEEAVALLSAAPCPSERATLIVSGTQMAMLVHETLGHPAELDRA